MPTKKRVDPTSTASIPSAKLADASPPPVNAQTPSPPDPTESWQQTHDALENALEQCSTSLDGTKDRGHRETLNAMIDVLSDELTALNQEGMKDRTISLQAAAEELGGGIQSLAELQQQLSKISSEIANAAKVADAVDGVLSGLKSVLSGFPIV